MTIECRGRKVKIVNYSLDLSYKAIKSIEEITNFEKCIDLKELILSGNQIKRIKGLEMLTELEHLDLSYNQIEKIENLETLNKLKRLNLSSNKIDKIENLSNSKALKELFLGGNSITEIGGLENLSNLEMLLLPGNNIKKIEGLENLHDLKILNIINNQITEISGLEFLFQLKNVDLDENEIGESELDLIEKDAQEIILYCQNKYCDQNKISREIKSKLNSEFKSTNIGFLMSIIIKSLNFDESNIDSLITLVNKLKYATHEKESVCSSILIVQQNIIERFENRIYPKPKSELKLDDTIKILTFSQLIDGCTGSVLITNNGKVIGNYLFGDAVNKYNPIMGREFLKAAYTSKETEGILFLFDGRGITYVFHKGNLILYCVNDNWGLNIRKLESKIHTISLNHSIEQNILRNILNISFEISRSGKGSLITLGDHESVLKICDSSLSGHIQWISVSIEEINSKQLFGIMIQDGATIISNDGLIIEAMIMLKPPLGAKGVEEIGKGTRHHTAAQVSGITEAICIAISQDGPISLYINGELALRLFGD